MVPYFQRLTIEKQKTKILKKLVFSFFPLKVCLSTPWLSWRLEGNPTLLCKVHKNRPLRLKMWNNNCSITDKKLLAMEGLDGEK